MNPLELNCILRLILNHSLSLTEKLACPAPGATEYPDECEAKRLIALWERIITQGHPQPGQFEDHLKTLGMTRDQALDLLRGRSLPIDTAWPPWTRLLEEVLLENGAGVTNPAGAELSDIASSPGEDSPSGTGAEGTPVFPEFLGRFVRVIVNRTRIQTGDNNEFMSESVVRSLSDFFIRRLSAQAARAVAYDVKTQAAMNELKGETSGQRYQYWVSDILGNRERLGLWLLKYPVLGRLLATMSLNLIDATSQLIRRVSEDHRELSLYFGRDGKLGRLNAITPGLSDPHRHGQTVCRLDFDCGTRVIYKPRDLSVDAAFNRLITWWNERQPSLSLRLVKLLQRRDYGWYEFLPRKECQSREEVSRYFQRQGIHLALFYLLGGTDFHHENFIPHGEWPVPIDLEGLLSLGVFDPYPPVGSAPPCLQPLSTSVISTLMLPAWRSGNQDRPLAFISGINGGDERVMPVPQPVWKNLGTDQIELAREYRIRDTTASRPIWGGQPVSVEPHLPCVIEGFRLAYETLQQSRQSLMNDNGPLLPFRSIENRRILRDTRQYDDLLFWSTSPDLLTSGTARDIALERLYERPLGPPFESTPIVPEEKQSLWAADIPIFFNGPDSCHLRSGNGIRFGPFDVQTPFSLMEQRLACFCEEDRSWQIELIRSSFGMSFESAITVPALMLEASDATGASQETFLRHAVALGEALERLALRDEHGSRWLILMRQPAYAGEVFYGVTDPWLYSGTAGTGLFLANLAEATHQSRFAELAQSAFRYADWNYRFLASRGDPMPLSGYCGNGSLIYSFVEAARLLNDSRWLDRALELRKTISTERIEIENNPDVVGGLAGLLWALLHLYKSAPSADILADMIGIGHRLIALQSPGENAAGWQIPGLDKVLLGMGHGAAGIANALVRLYGITGLEAFRSAAIKGLQFERHHFSASHGDWPNLQNPSQEPHFMTGWCAGAPGAGLARLGLKFAWPDNAALEQEIKCAVTATIRHLGTDSHHLCCGECGRILLLQEAALRLQSPSLAERAREAGLNLAAFYETNGFWKMQSCSDRAILPELMGGISGIGLTFLTLAAPERRSKVLTLE